MTDPAQPVEATPTPTLVERLRELASCHWEYGHERILEEAATALSLAQTENAGHIRIEDELKAELKIQDDANEILQRRLDETQARCAELEKLLAEAVKDRSDANYTLGTDLVDRIDSALKPLRIPE